MGNINMLRTACAGIALLAFTNSMISPALAAGCAKPADAIALRAAVMQQQLMVAAFQCQESDTYNRFVIAYRKELRSSDAALKSFFLQRDGKRGEDSYDRFKTKAANIWGLEQARHSAAFCADAHELYRDVLDNRNSLARFVEARADAFDIGDICIESRPGGAMLASSATRP